MYMVQDGDLTYKLVAQRTVLIEDRERMYELMQQNYVGVELDTFRSDLEAKDFVGLIRDSSNDLQGFTTYVVNPKGFVHQDYNLLFSGDTIIAPDHWGSQIMMKGWSYTIGQIIAGDKTKKWYWYLLTKGHRTYMYLPLFFKKYYPHIEVEDTVLKRIAHEGSSHMYPNNWFPDLGVLKFPDNAGAMNQEHIDATYKKQRSRYVAFYLEKNPYFYNADELVCIAPLEVDNLMRSSHTYALEGYKNPIAI